MPATSRLLYYDLGMNADDDGFVEWFMVTRMSGSTEQDLRVLQANGFVHVFDENVLIITDWKENNKIRKDRYQKSRYIGVYNLETIDTESVSEQCQPNDNQMTTAGTHRLGKDRLGKDRLGNTSKANASLVKTKYNPLGAEIIKAMEGIDPKNKRYYGNTTQRKACDELLEYYGLENVLKQIELYKELLRRGVVPYLPDITTPCQLRDKYQAINRSIERELSKKKAEAKKHIIL